MLPCCNTWMGSGSHCYCSGLLVVQDTDRFLCYSYVAHSNILSLRFICIQGHCLMACPYPHPFIGIQGSHLPAQCCTATDRWLCHRPLPLCHCPLVLKFHFVLLQSLLIPLGIHRCYKKQYILCIECHENTYKIKSVRAGVSTNSTAPTAL